MAKYLLTRTDKLRYFRKQLSFHNKLRSSIAARIRYHFCNEDLKNSLKKAIKEMRGDSYELDWVRDKEFILDLLFCREFFAIQTDEYQAFRSSKLNEKEKLDYVGWLELGYYDMLLNEQGNPHVFELKEKTSEVFDSFYGREVVAVHSDQDIDKVSSFFERHGAGIVKPNAEYGGHGIAIYRITDTQTFEQIWDELEKKIPFVVEELIDQAPEMSAFYPHAVNTIRYNTFFHDGKLTKLQAVLRMGTGHSEVDNASSGGIFARVDTDTGRVIGPARNLRGETFETHPDTGIQFEGSVIPRWDELNQLLEKVVRVVPEQKQVGWDFALSKNGWIMVEGNATPMYQQFDPEHGLRETVKSTFGQVIKMWG